MLSSQSGVVVRKVYVNVSMDRGNSHVVDKRHAVWPAERIIFVDGETHDFEERLVYLDQLRVNLHHLFVERLQPLVISLSVVELQEVNELLKVASPNAVVVEV